AEERYDLEPADESSPDKVFEKQWALALLSGVLTRLEMEHEREGKKALFTALKPSLMGARESQPYVELAQQLGLNEGAVKVAVHRLRRRYKEMVRQEIAHTLGPGEDVEEEMRHLFQALTGE